MDTKIQKRISRRRRIRSRVNGTAQRPRLSVFKSNTYVYAQMIDDEKSRTLTTANDKNIKTGTKTSRARAVGKLIAERAIAKGISAVVFDRGGFMYTGRIRALAESARENGLKF